MPKETIMFKYGLFYKVNFELPNGVLCNEFEVKIIPSYMDGINWRQENHIIKSKPKKNQIYTLCALLFELGKLKTQYGVIDCNPTFGTTILTFPDQLTLLLEEKQLTHIEKFKDILVLYQEYKHAEILI
jgi:hypothetical protein